MKDLIADLAAEQQELDDLVAGLSASQWDLVTPAAPWTIRDTISHLAFFDERQTQAIADPEAFVKDINARLATSNDDYIAIALDRGRSLTPEEVLNWWREARVEELRAFATVDPATPLAWYGPAMKAASAVAARLMETWAHGHDIADALGIRRTPTHRLIPIAELGVKTFSWSFLNRGLVVPEERVRVALTDSDGIEEVWNPQVTGNSITGPVEDFCLVVAQRRHVDDTDLVMRGEVARQWMEVAQVFAGPPGPGRPPRHRD